MALFSMAERLPSQYFGLYRAFPVGKHSRFAQRAVLSSVFTCMHLAGSCQHPTLSLLAFSKPLITFLFSNLVAACADAEWRFSLAHHQFVLHSRLFGALMRVDVVDRCRRLLFLFGRISVHFGNPVLRPVVLGLVKLVLSLVVGVVLWVQVALYIAL